MRTTARMSGFSMSVLQRRVPHVRRLGVTAPPEQVKSRRNWKCNNSSWICKTGETDRQTQVITTSRSRDSPAETLRLWVTHFWRLRVNKSELKLQGTQSYRGPTICESHLRELNQVPTVSVAQLQKVWCTHNGDAKRRHKKGTEEVFEVILHCPEASSPCDRQEKKLKSGRSELSFFTDDMMIYLENPKESTQKL